MQHRCLRICFLLLTLLMCAVTHTASVAMAAERPNVIFILADDAGYGDFGCFGQKVIPTPNIDRMAAEGMKFTRHYAGSTVCAPSRCVFLTGLHTGHCLVRGNSPGALPVVSRTVAKVMKRAGYTTGCIGKWGIGNPPPLDDPQRQGFDEFYGYINMFHAHNFYPDYLIRNGKRVSTENELFEKWVGGDGRGVAKKRIDYVPNMLSDEVVSFIERHRSEPFFLFYSLNIPHTNNEAGRESERPEKGMEVPDFGPFADKDWPAPEKGFATMIHHIDQDVGRILQTLKRLQLDQNTLVILTSDNGPHSEGGHDPDFFDSNGPFRGKKRDLYEGGIRMPCLMRWPGHIVGGSESDLLSGFQDYLPTFADLTEQSLSEPTDGVSLVPTLMGNDGAQKTHDHLYWEFTEQGGKRGLVRGPWKIIELNVRQSRTPIVELYHLENDPGETTNVAKKHPRVVQELRELMNRSHTASENFPLFPGEQ